MSDFPERTIQEGWKSLQLRVAAAEARAAELEAAMREMILSLPGGSFCDPQEVADTLRKVAEEHGVIVE